MVENGSDTSLVARTGLVLGLVVLCCCFVCGCSSNRKTVSATKAETHQHYTDTSARESAVALGADRTYEHNTAISSAIQLGNITINRDSAGRVEEINWAIESRGEAAHAGTREVGSAMVALHDGQHTAVTGTVDTIDEATEEATQTVDPRISLEWILGPIILGLVLLYVASRLWQSIKQ